MPTPENLAREHIDQALEHAGWRVQDYKSSNLHAGRGVVLRNFPLVSGHGFAGYLLYVDGRSAGVVEAKKKGFPLVGVEVERRLSVIKELEDAVEANLTRADRLRQSILSQAFSGQLVKQGSKNNHSTVPT